MTRRQSNNQWSGSITAHPGPQNIRVQISAGIVLASIFWDQDGILLINYPPKGQTVNAEYYSSLLMQLKDILKEKTPREGHRGGLVLARQCPCSPATYNPEDTGLPGPPMSWSPTLLSGSGPVGLPPVTWTEKKLKGRHISSDAEVIAAAETWLDGQTFEFFFEWLAKVTATG